MKLKQVSTLYWTLSWFLISTHVQASDWFLSGLNNTIFDAKNIREKKTPTLENGKGGVFIKLNQKGFILPYNAKKWRCIFDQSTGLFWLNNASALKRVSFSKKPEIIAKANQQAFCGYSDWRMPSKQELKTLSSKYNYFENQKWIYSGSSVVPHIYANSSFFSDLDQQAYPYYWSATEGEFSQFGVALSLLSGNLEHHLKDSRFYMRLVRANPKGSENEK